MYIYELKFDIYNLIKSFKFFLFIQKNVLVHRGGMLIADFGLSKEESLITSNSLLKGIHSVISRKDIKDLGHLIYLALEYYYGKYHAEKYHLLNFPIL